MFKKWKHTMWHKSVTLSLLIRHFLAVHQTFRYNYQHPFCWNYPVVSNQLTEWTDRSEWWDLTNWISVGNQLQKMHIYMWKMLTIPFFSLSKHTILLRLVAWSLIKIDCRRYFQEVPILFLLQMQNILPSGSEKYYASP